jgi:putative tryptophan/tyrosine transport system substrate-binding protein
MRYGTDHSEANRQTCIYVAASSDLPMQQPTKFELVISLKTAKTLGLTIPPGVPPSRTT